MSRKQKKGHPDEGKGKGAAPKARKEKVLEPKGPKPESYAPKHGEAGAEANPSLYIDDVYRLLNGIVDREKYRTGGAEFEKEEIPRFKGAPEGDTICAVRFIGAVEGHELLLSGVQPGMGVPAKKLASPVFATSSKVKEVQQVQHALWKYLHKYLTSKGQEPKPAAQPPVKVVNELDPTNPVQIWEGKNGLVQVSGITFRVTDETAASGYQFKVVYVHTAPYETELFGLDAVKVYISVGNLHSPEFRSKLPEGSKERMAQERIWAFLRKVFAEAGIGEQEKEQEKQKPEKMKPYGGAVIRNKPGNRRNPREEAIKKGFIRPAPTKGVGENKKQHTMPWEEGKVVFTFS